MGAITIKVVTRSGKPLTDVQIGPEATVGELKKKIHASKSKYYPARQRLTLPPKAGTKSGEVLKDSATLASQGLKDGSVIYFKDLGIQIGYSTVFFFEYFGPMVIYPAFFFFPQIFYPWATAVPEKTLVQKVACAYWAGHYAKRIGETFLVHVFGHDTMPVFNLFKNCSYYYGFAAYVAYFANHPDYTSPPEKQSLVLFAVATLFQLANLRCHIILKNLRKPGEKGYKIPSGFLFNYITCANYYAEIMGWVCFSLATRTLTGALFTIAGAYQMAIWAQGKHRRLQKLFDGKDGRPKYPKRWIMIPLLF
ncbi:hypothetical protein Rsub_07124 [Raphidocelis subcapitata]|uniref:very-long-chain enoyl-CoA reductase n=1 Tax=Raphidocelis subcapitata TaxID=307507 RepID=A0A2V0PAE2_9CHLO|nr:hypothetical protein Rsub_07124 [Raphidocelis subcapitata]|eukprot:GBF94137.1 hypothetical protein Rsub_07124 [Raphidocelis subcapitata]